MAQLRNAFFTMGIRSLLAVVLVLALALPAHAAQISTAGKQGIVMDYDTGTVLFEKDADTKLHPASMTKIMTAYLVFERLKDGRVKMDDTFLVSEKAWRKGGSKMFVELGKAVSVGDLLRGMIVASGNDACIVLAEGIAGSEDDFVALMNAKAQELGMTSSVFRNTTGWPDPDHYSTPRDLALLGKRLIQDFPEYYPIYSEVEFTYHKIKQGNRNPLLYKNIGADGIKTGHTEEAGYGLVASAQGEGRRLILVLSGMASMQERADESTKVMLWAFREFSNYTLFKKGQVIDTATTWLGKTPTVPLTVEKDLIVTLPRDSLNQGKVHLSYVQPVSAPVSAGQRLGTLKVEVPDFITVETSLVAAQDVTKIGVFGKMRAVLRHILFGTSARKDAPQEDAKKEEATTPPVVVPSVPEPEVSSAPEEASTAPVSAPSAPVVDAAPPSPDVQPVEE